MAYYASSAANSGYTSAGYINPSMSTNGGYPNAPNPGMSNPSAGARQMSTSPGCGVICPAGRGSSQDEQPILTYVGAMRGDYIQETTYKYVGNGRGEFGVVDNGSRTNWCCMCYAIIGLLTLVVFAGMMIWPSVYPDSATSTTTRLSGPAGAPMPKPKPKPGPPPAAPASFDCAAGFANWQTGWAPAKKQWCCAHGGKGCPPPPPPPPPVKPGAAPAVASGPVAPPPPAANGATTPLPFDCNAGFNNWVVGWSPAKKEWCCAHGGKGCAPAGAPARTTSESTYDCNAGFSNWNAGWSVPKKVWCCQHTSKGCPPGAPPGGAPAPFDCGDGFATWQTSWSPAKKTWCCNNSGKGCVH